jgi:hypothetical protein
MEHVSVSPDHPYKLVELAACYCGLHAAAWKDAFKAEVFVGFNSILGQHTGLMEDFHEKFWQLLEARATNHYTIAQAANEAWAEVHGADGEYDLVVDVDGTGDITFDACN